MKRPLTRSFGTGLAIAGLLMSSAASAAPVIPKSVDPLVALSFFGTQSSRAAVCAAGAASLAASAAAAQAAPAQPGCVLPVVDAAPVVAEPPPPPPPVAPVYAEPVGGGIAGLLPALVLLGALAAILILVGDGEGGDPDFNPPPSPA